MIACSNLTRRFGKTTAVDGISFELPSGSLCAFLGPNGAGKSTTLKLLTGLLQPDEGQITIAGRAFQAGDLALKRVMGVLPERLGLFDHLTVEEHLYMVGALYGFSKAEIQTRTERLLSVLALSPNRDTYAEHCSHGTRKKLSLALALVHEPRVILLDEPFEGVDPITARIIQGLLKDLANSGVTVFFTSHALALAERMATHYIVIRQGRICWNGHAETLPSSLEQHYFDLLEAPASAAI